MSSTTNINARVFRFFLPYLTPEPNYSLFLAACQVVNCIHFAINESKRVQNQTTVSLILNHFYFCSSEHPWQLTYTAI